MSDLPTIDTWWEYDLGTQLGRVAVRVANTDPETMSVVLDGPAPFPRRVSIWDFLAHAVPPKLKR
jgi:hypothetical protein